MTQTLPHSALHGSRLVRLLLELGVSRAELTHSQFIERLGQLIDLPDSVILSDTHTRTAVAGAAAAASVPEAAGGIREEFLAVRSLILRTVAASFVPGAAPDPGRVRLPVPAAAVPQDKSAAHEPYLRFYAGHQREIDASVRRLQLNVRSRATAASPELAQLAALDTTLADTFLTHTRKAFAVIPVLLTRRFEQLVGQYQQDLRGEPDDYGQWLQLLGRYCSELQGLLLAEVETRLLPVLGLTEAIHDHAEAEL